MSNFNETAQYAMENKRRLERNSRFYHEYRRAVENVFRALPENTTIMVPFEFAVALGDLRRIHQEAEGDE
jgi:hypothetical protein